MGLFTNRKKEDEEDVAGLSEAADMLAQFNAPTFEESAQVVHAGSVAAESPSAPTASFFPAGPIADLSSVDAVDEVVAAPIGESAFDTSPAASEAARPEEDAPRRRLEDRPRAQAGNVEIDVDGLLKVLDVDADSSLTDIREAQQRFLADHQPADTDDADTAGIKEKIRCEVNMAYASFRLTRTS